VIESPDAGTDLIAARSVGHAEGHALCVAVRPEKIHLAKEGEPFQQQNRLTGTIKDLAYLGDSCVYHIQLPTGKVLKVTAPNHGRWTDRPFSRDEIVQLGWAGEASVLVAS
jgi:putrescine transport system ATP-binding protein